MRATSALVALILGCSFLVSCGGAPVRQVAAQTAKTVPMGTDAKPIQFKKVVIKLRRGEVIGQNRVGLVCLPAGDIQWRGGRVNVDDEEFTDVFREELENHNYPVVGDPNALFDDPSTWQAELLVAGLINSMQVNACYPMAGFGNYSDSKGAAYVKVGWQIYGQLERRVVYEVTTEGSFESDDSVSMGIETALTNAFGVAVQNLLADAGFHKLVTSREASQNTATASQAPIVLPALGFASTLTQARDATVTVFAGEGHGSGFVISSDGHVLTNEHVVREARFVRVQMANKREVLGDVLRTDSTHDVALVKLREGNFPAAVLLLGAQPVVGSDVFAIGTPRDVSLDVTISKGIVSAYRDEMGRKFIQSDVQIHPGNSGGPLVTPDGRVVGIAARGFTVSGASQNLNWFIPIDNAVSALNLQFR